MPIKSTPIFTALGLICFSTLQADVEMRISKLESKMRDAGVSNARGTFGGNLADGSPNIDGYGFYVSTDMIVFQITEDNNEYAIAGVTANNTCYASTFDWDFGFRTGLGYYSEHDAWQTGLSFTWLYNTASDSISANAPNEIATPNTLDQYSNTYSRVSDSWDVYFYNLDWTLGRDFFVSKYLSFSPNLGIKSTWFYQTRHVKGDLKTPESTPVDGEFFKDRFNGVGPKADVLAKFYLGKNFSILGKVDTALLFSTNKTSSNYFQGNTSQTKIKYKKNHITPYLGASIGLGYDTNFSEDQFNLGIDFTYELQYYGKANRMLQYYSWDLGSDLTMQGVDLSFTFSF